jgi:hypothetical protein
MLRRVPKICKSNACSKLGAQDDPHHLVIHGMGLDMVGQFKRAPGGRTHLLVAVDKFTNWIEAKPITKCDGKTLTKFVHEKKKVW